MSDTRRTPASAVKSARLPTGVDGPGERFAGSEAEEMLESPVTNISLDRREALMLMARVPVGRVVVTEDALPAVHPVLFALDGDRVVFRAHAGSALARGAHDCVVAFQADRIDIVERTGWTTTVTGRSTRVTDPADVERLERLLPSGRGEDDYSWFSVTSEIVTGQRTGRPRAQ